jgi:taurine dioxygenase
MAQPEVTPTHADAGLEIRKLTPVIGAEIGGVDLSKEQSDATIAGIRQALLDHRVIFFRDQAITSDQHIAFGRRFGELEIHPFTQNKEGHPEIILLANGPENKSRINVWHSDVTWRQEPSLGSILKAVEVPETGGDTLWANMVAAYEGLPDELQKRIDGLFAIHDFTNSFGRRLSPEELAKMQEKHPPARHPVVRTHPETGEKALYVNGAFTEKIEGMKEDESRRLLGILYIQARVPEYQMRFQWRPGSIAFWDNRTTQHYPVSDYWPQVRSMERVTVVGDRPV